MREMVVDCFLFGLACAAWCLVAAAAHAQTLQPGEAFRDCDACPLMKVVPAGIFVMGPPPSGSGHFHNEGIIRTVSIANPFAVGQYEVTVDEWNACVGAGRCNKAPDGGWGSGAFPVTGVTWEQAVGYTRWLSEISGRDYRLLSEAEWEYAARAGRPRFRFFGLAPQELCRFANVYDLRSKADYDFDWPHAGCDDGFAGLAPVGSLEPNDFGLHDMLGNASEWALDCYNRSWRFAKIDGSAWLDGDCLQRAYRGGSWLANEPRYLRTPDRYRYYRARSDDLGFRVGRSLP